MKKNRILDKNQIVVACLFFICVLLIFTIFFISNRTIPAAQDTQSCVTREDVAEAYAFLGQDEAVESVLSGSSSDEVFTYGEYREFLKQLYLWEAGNFEGFLDWDDRKDEGVSPDVL